ncbi:MAG TPA: site-2 protease family protein [Pseudonocardiaceae bacterium]|nr:site-2 protease family protein [Pseudonocardiaceae bacterium]
MNRAGIRPSPIFLGILGAAVVGGLLLSFFQTSEAAVDGGMLLLVLGGWGVSLCLHEFGHAYVAYKGGDFAVRTKGYLTLDIRRYTDPVFSIVLPLLFLAFGGIPLPGGAVWVNHHALRSKRVECLVSLAGPFSNLVLGVLLTQAVRLTPTPTFELFGPVSALSAGLSYLALLQILAFVLNILPIPGLDGWGAIEPWLPYEAKKFGQMVRPWAPLVLFVLLLGVASVGEAFFWITDHVFNAVGGDPNLAGIGQDTFLFWRN